MTATGFRPRFAAVLRQAARDLDALVGARLVAWQRGDSAVAVRRFRAVRDVDRLGFAQDGTGFAAVGCQRGLLVPGAPPDGDWEHGWRARRQPARPASAHRGCQRARVRPLEET